MCYNFKASITAWIIALISCLYMLSYPEIYGTWIPLFILTFSQIQILEAIIWSNGNKNTETTRILMFFLLLQPLINSFLGYRNTNNKFLLYSSFFYGAIIIYHLITSRNDEFITLKGSTGNLIWNRFRNGKQVHLFGNEFIGMAYLVGLCFPFFFMEGNIKYVPLFTGIITFIISMIRNPCKIHSTCCHSVIMMSVIMILYPHIKN